MVYQRQGYRIVPYPSSTDPWPSFSMIVSDHIRSCPIIYDPTPIIPCMIGYDLIWLSVGQCTPFAPNRINSRVKRKPKIFKSRNYRWSYLITSDHIWSEFGSYSDRIRIVFGPVPIDGQSMLFSTPYVFFFVTVFGQCIDYALINDCMGFQYISAPCQ